MIPRAVSVDNTIFGAIPLELYIETKEQVSGYGQAVSRPTMAGARGKDP